jgi:hypothetical protein
LVQQTTFARPCAWVTHGDTITQGDTMTQPKKILCHCVTDFLASYGYPSVIGHLVTHGDTMCHQIITGLRNWWFCCKSSIGVGLGCALLRYVTA